MSSLQRAYDNMTPEEPPECQCPMCGEWYEAPYMADDGPLCQWCDDALRHGLCRCRCYDGIHAAGAELCEYEEPEMMKKDWLNWGLWTDKIRASAKGGAS